MSLFADYIQERTCKQVMETDTGFVVYSYLWDDLALFIEEIYIIPEARRKKIGTDYVNTIVETAKKRGAKQVVCSWDPLSANATDSIQAILSYGFKPMDVVNKMVNFSKEL